LIDFNVVPFSSSPTPKTNGQEEKRFRTGSKYKTRERQLRARRLDTSLGETDGVLYGNVEYERY
jgi:hypothetical protein